jgi:hypothetical protein
MPAVPSACRYFYGTVSLPTLVTPWTLENSLSASGLCFRARLRKLPREIHSLEKPVLLVLPDNRFNGDPLKMAYTDLVKKCTIY